MTSSLDTFQKKPCHPIPSRRSIHPKTELVPLVAAE